MLIINTWIGRTGNNILQLVRAIHYAILNNHDIIIFKNNYLLNSNAITIKLQNKNELQMIDSFFSLKKYNIIDPEPYLMKEYFQKYIKPIFKIKLDENNTIIDDKIVYIHFRGGDIFSNNPHKAYVQPPLSYYKNIINNYDNTVLVCEDKKNPCINELLKQENTQYISNTIEKDLSILSNVSNLVIGFGTFGFLLYLMNLKLKNLYIPDFFVDELPKGSWGNDLKIHIIELPDYIKVGDWKNNTEQRKLMLEY
uniref:Glycosyltransferase n=1 Tax=Florenciella sp. virus SA2 TaxID=3240092 RepID=A0AB39J946_9VIRU